MKPDVITFFQNWLPCSLAWFWPYSLCKKINFLMISNYIIVFGYWQDAWVSAHVPWNICTDWSCVIPGRSRSDDHQPYRYTYRIHQWDQLWLANHDHAYGLYLAHSRTIFYRKTSHFLLVTMIEFTYIVQCTLYSLI